MAILTLQYRPTRFRDMVGQSHIKPVLRAMVAHDDVPPAMIFAGSRGTGKTSGARIFAAALNCEAVKGGDACGECGACLAVQKTGAESVLEIDAASNGGVAEVRKIRELCLYAHPGRWRVVLLDEAHSLSRDAFNALLKILEEPPPNTVFVLLTTEAEKIIETVRSRSMSFDFRRLTEGDIRSRLRFIADAEGIEAEDGLLAVIASEVQGGMRDAVMQLDQCRRAQVSSAAGYAEMLGIHSVAQPLLIAALDGDFVLGHQIIEEHFGRSGDASRLVNDLVALAVKCLVVRGGGRVQASSSELEDYTYIAHRLDERRLTAVIRLLWELKERSRVARDDQRGTMEMAFVLISEALHAGKVGSILTTTAAPTPAKLSLTDIARLTGTGK